VTYRSPLALAALATAAVRGLDVVATRLPQHTSTDFQTTGVLDSAGRQWVVRCPRNASAGAALEAEVALLEQLAPEVKAGSLPFAVPEPAGFAPLPEGGRAMVYRQLRGRPLDVTRLRPGPGLAADLGRSIAALHELPGSLLANAGLPAYEVEDYRNRCQAEVDEAARTGRVPPSVLHRWERAFEDVALWRFRPTPVHGDLAEENVWVLDDEVAGMLNFTSAHVGDPAVDLAWLAAAAPEESLDSIAEAYALARPEMADKHLFDRAALVSEIALARWLLHGVRTADEAIIDDAVAMLHELADHLIGAPPIGHREPVVVPGDSAVVADADDAPATTTDETVELQLPDEDDAGGAPSGQPASGEPS